MGPFRDARRCSRRLRHPFLDRDSEPGPYWADRAARSIIAIRTCSSALPRIRVTAKLSAIAGAMSRASIFSVIISRSPNLRNDCEGQHSIVYIYGAAWGLAELAAQDAPELVAAEIHQDGGFQPFRPSDLRTNLWRVSALLFGRGRANYDLVGEQRTGRPGLRHSCKSWMPVESALICLGTPSGSSADCRREAFLTGRRRQDLSQLKDSRMSHRHSKHGFRPTAGS
jgi:hypothetical protein